MIVSTIGYILMVIGGLVVLYILGLILLATLLAFLCCGPRGVLFILVSVLNPFNWRLK